MTKLEQKLIELGYFKDYCYKNEYHKITNDSCCITIILDNECNEIEGHTIHSIPAYNQLQNDLKELKEYE